MPSDPLKDWDDLPLAVRSAAPRPLLAFLNPLTMIASLWQQRELIRGFSARETAARHRGSQLGGLWAVLNPLLVLAVYTFVFGVILNQRWHVLGGQPAEFPLTMLCGVALFTVFADVVTAAPMMIVGKPNYVTKVVFPLEIFPVAALGSALFFMAIYLVLIVIGAGIFLRHVSSTLWLFPLVLVPLGALTLGVSWLFASLGVYLRDLHQIVGLVVGKVLMLLTPLFFPVTSVPEPFRGWFMLNPLTVIIENGRRTLLWGEPPDWVSLSAVTVFSLVVMQVGYAWFMKSRRSFGDVL